VRVAKRDDSLDHRLARLGGRIRELRSDLSLSQEELAHRAGLHRTYIGSVERGERNVTIGNVWVLADTLGVSILDLLQGEQATEA
jgi:transcriptional regulator with XRE-family HTH domain